MSDITTSPSKIEQTGFLGWVERAGNKIPHPFLLFVYLLVILMVASCILSSLNVSVINPTNNEPVFVKNLLSSEGLQWIFPNIIKNFSGFAPLGSILALVLGAGLAERVGLLRTLMYRMASGVKAKYASYLVLFIAFFSHISSDAALVIMPPLGALIFLAVGRHPIAGLLAAIAGVGSGFTANLLIVTTDVLLSGISTEAAKVINPTLSVSVVDNWYFMATSVVVLTIIGALITDKIIEPRLGTYHGEHSGKLEKITDEQKRALKYTGIVALIFIGLMALLIVPESAPLRDPKLGTIVPSPFMRGIVPTIILFFSAISITYGVFTKQIRSASDIPNLMTDPMKTMAGFIVMVFPLAQFVAFFNWSNMGKFMAIGFTQLIQSAHLSGLPIFIGLIFLSSFLCMFIASGSAIWSLLAPVFVPMFILLGYHPAFAQMIFRVADSSVIPLAPVSPFIPLFLGFLQVYRKEAKLGTYYTLILPYPLIFFLVWIILVVVWYLSGLPIGPGIYPQLSATSL